MNSAPLPARAALINCFSGSQCPEMLSGWRGGRIEQEKMVLVPGKVSLLQVLRLRVKTRFILTRRWKTEAMSKMWGKLSKIHVYYLKSNLTNLNQCPKQVQSFRNVKKITSQLASLWKPAPWYECNYALKYHFWFSLYFFGLLCNHLQKKLLLAHAALGIVIQAKAVYVQLFCIFVTSEPLQCAKLGLLLCACSEDSTST